MSEPLLDVRNVDLYRDASQILTNVSLKVAIGQHTAIIGPNGCGKTSLLKLLLRQFYPSISTGGQQGTVTILGEQHWHVAELRRQMGVVSALLDHQFSLGRTGRMSVRQCVASGFNDVLLPERCLALSTEMESRIADTMKRTGVESIANRTMNTLSTGQRRRAIIARALVHAPSILVLDEPTTGLDLAARRELLLELQSIADHSRVTLLLVTHHLDEILPAIDHVVLMQGGVITASGSKSRTLTSQALSEVFGVSIQLEQSRDGWFTASLE
ncbi:MAG: ATP-binding cassette domain-containing protein [Planctomycetota bacterium]